MNNAPLGETNVVRAMAEALPFARRPSGNADLDDRDLFGLMMHACMILHGFKLIGQGQLMPRGEDPGKEIFGAEDLETEDSETEDSETVNFETMESTLYSEDLLQTLGTRLPDWWNKFDGFHFVYKHPSTGPMMINLDIKGCEVGGETTLQVKSDISQFELPMKLKNYFGLQNKDEPTNWEFRGLPLLTYHYENSDISVLRLAIIDAIRDHRFALEFYFKKLNQLIPKVLTKDPEIDKKKLGEKSTSLKEKGEKSGGRVDELPGPSTKPPPPPSIDHPAQPQSSDDTKPTTSKHISLLTSPTVHSVTPQNDSIPAPIAAPVQPPTFDDPLQVSPRHPTPAGDFPPPRFEDEYEMNRPPRILPPSQSGPPFSIGHDDLYPQGLGPHDPLRSSLTDPSRGMPGMGGMHPTFNDPLFRGDQPSRGYDPQVPPGARYDPTGPGDTARPSPSRNPFATNSWDPDNTTYYEGPLDPLRIDNNDLRPRPPRGAPTGPRGLGGSPFDGDDRGLPPNMRGGGSRGGFGNPFGGGMGGGMGGGFGGGFGGII